jgi:hypothetical protein
MKKMNACAVTLAKKRPLAEEEILLQSGTIETIKRHMCLPDVNLPIQLSGRSRSIHLTQSYLVVAIFSSILRVS